MLLLTMALLRNADNPATRAIMRLNSRTACPNNQSTAIKPFYAFSDGYSQQGGHHNRTNNRESSNKKGTDSHGPHLELQKIKDMYYFIIYGIFLLANISYKPNKRLQEMMQQLLGQSQEKGWLNSDPGTGIAFY